MGEKGIGRYSTLSHCWGESEIMNLTSENLGKFKSGFPIGLLPKTFIEAIYVARKMSISYIWIDSLCIKQDSITDWQVESALMDDVYGHSALNIMATVSKNSHEGLSRYRDPKVLQICPPIETKWPNAENDLFHMINEVIWARTMNTSPLLKRGWVLQERILSRRSLHFCKHELLWECRELAASETYPPGLPEICKSSQSDVKLKELSGSESYGESPKYLIDGAQKTPKGVAYDRWATWISLYSRTQLTQESDKLVAISALAKCTRTALADVYLAGLWKSVFTDQLVWYGVDSTSSPQYRAPSWSWASINGPVYLASIRPGTEYHMKIDEVKVTPVSSLDETGSICSGHFRARGLLIRDTLVRVPDYDTPFRLVGKTRHAPLYVHLDTPIKQEEISVVTLPILTYSTRKKNNPYAESIERFHALLLQRKLGAPPGYYTRIGHMESETSFMENSKRSGPRRALRMLFRKDVSLSDTPDNVRLNETDPKTEMEETLYLKDSPGSFVVY